MLPASQKCRPAVPWENFMTCGHQKGGDSLEAVDITEFIRLYGKAVYGFCGKLVYDQADREDLYQETFLKALELSHKIDRRNNPKAFLISIALGL
jgi:RNA polymerase sigma-70 factor (ECF subfamily)